MKCSKVSVKRIVLMFIVEETEIYNFVHNSHKTKSMLIRDFSNFMKVKKHLENILNHNKILHYRKGKIY